MIEAQLIVSKFQCLQTLHVLKQCLVMAAHTLWHGTLHPRAVKTSLSPPLPQVMNRGQVKEFDRPNRLLQKPDSLFRRMVEQTGEVAARKLAEMAQEAELRRRASRKDSVL